MAATWSRPPLLAVVITLWLTPQSSHEPSGWTTTAWTWFGPILIRSLLRVTTPSKTRRRVPPMMRSSGSYTGCDSLHLVADRHRVISRTGEHAVQRTAIGTGLALALDDRALTARTERAL